MKRRNFLSGLLAAPLALKARFFAAEPVRQLSALQLRVARLMAEGKSMREIAEILRPGSLDLWAKRAVGRSNAWLN